MSKYFDDLYSNKRDYFSFEATRLLKENCHRINKIGRVLDIGAGTGRNTLFLARQGFSVDAIDSSQVGIDMIKKVAVKDELPITASACGFSDFSAEVESYSAILMFGLMQVLKWAEIDLLMHLTGEWTKGGSLVFVTAWTTIDPGFEKKKAELETIGKNSFIERDGNTCTFLEENEILRLFEGYEVIHHYEGLGPWHSHSGGPAERHGSVEALFRRL